MIRRYSFKEIYLRKLRNYSPSSLKVNTIRWYTDLSKTGKGTGAGVFGPKTKYSEPMGNLPESLPSRD